jgi:NitT/TauT family transport system substrate-binding protein
VQSQLSKVKLFDLDGNKSIAFDRSNPRSLIGNLELTAKGAHDFKMVPRPINVQSLYDDAIVQST